MPLPRFHRLPDEEQRRIIGVARGIFARDGVDGASYKAIIDASGISKSSAYNYFDGREDLLYAVLDDVGDRLAEVLGWWAPTDTAEAFWTEFDVIAARLHQHVDAHPDDLALIDPAFMLREQSRFMVWIREAVDNGIDIGVITVDVDRDLLVAATAAVLRAGDGWVAARLREGSEPDVEQTWILIRSLWGAASPGALPERVDVAVSAKQPRSAGNAEPVERLG